MFRKWFSSHLAYSFVVLLNHKRHALVTVWAQDFPVSPLLRRCHSQETRDIYWHAYTCKPVLSAGCLSLNLHWIEKTRRPRTLLSCRDHNHLKHLEALRSESSYFYSKAFRRLCTVTAGPNPQTLDAHQEPLWLNNVLSKRTPQNKLSLCT